MSEHSSQPGNDWRKVIGKERRYNKAFANRSDVVLWEVFPVEDGEELALYFESKNSDWHQGVWLMCNQGITVAGQEAPSIYLWYEHSPSEIKFTCRTDNGLLSIYNVWDRGFGLNSQSHSSGMLVEKISNGRRYQCNDIGFDTQFDKLVFRIERTRK